MYEHNALGYSWGLALYLTKVRSSRARCPATALIRLFLLQIIFKHVHNCFMIFSWLKCLSHECLSCQCCYCFINRFLVEYTNINICIFSVFIFIFLWLHTMAF